MKIDQALQTVVLGLILLAASTGCQTVVGEKGGVDAAVYDMERIYKRVETLQTAARVNNKPDLMRDSDLMLAYGDAASFLNGYWKNVIGDLSSGITVNRTRDQYLAQPEHAQVDKFVKLSEQKLKSLNTRESVGVALVADEVIKVIDYFLKRHDQLDQKARDDFKAYLQGLKVVSWGDQFHMPAEPDFWTKKKSA